MLSVFSYACWPFVYFWRNVFSKSFDHILNSYLCVFLIYRNSLYIVDVNCSSVTRFTNISSHSVGSLFTLLIVSFDAQKFLLFMSSLSVFTFVTCAFGVMFNHSLPNLML